MVPVRVAGEEAISTRAIILLFALAVAASGVGGFAARQIGMSAAVRQQAQAAPASAAVGPTVRPTLSQTQVVPT